MLSYEDALILIREVYGDNVVALTGGQWALMTEEDRSKYIFLRHGPFNRDVSFYLVRPNKSDGA